MSSRALDASLLSNSQSDVFAYLLLVDLAFPSGNVRLHNGAGTIELDGITYFGVGGFGSIDIVTETMEISDNPIRLTLSSITPEIITAMQTDDIYNRSADIFLQAINADSQPVGSPTNWIAGYMETAALNVGADNAVTITIQTAAARLNFRSNKRFTLEEHQKKSPGDLFFQFLPYVVNADVQWAGERVRTGFQNDGSTLTRRERIIAGARDWFNGG